jgi:membrane-associated phospholipid phosphatase
VRNTLDRRTLIRLGAAATAALGGAQLSVAARTALASRASSPSVEPDAGTWRTWFLASGSALRLPPPPDAREELAQVRGMLERLDSDGQDRVAYWAAGAPPYRWNEIATEMFFGGAFRSGNYARIQAYLNAAIHDATVAAWDSKYAYHRPRPSHLDPSLVPLVSVPASPAYPSEHAAAGGAAAEVLANFAPDQADSLRAMAEEAASSRVWAGVQFPSDAAAGLDLGRSVARLAIAAAKADNYDTAAWDGTRPEGPGLWQGQNPTGVADRFWKPWIVPSADALRPPPPPAYDSPERAQEIEAVKNFPRTPTTNRLAMWVQYEARGPGNRNIAQNREISRRIFEEHLEDSPLAARIYALVHATYLDAWITTQDAKFTYWTARPNMFDPSITTLFPNPNHPSYVSNGSALATSPAIVMAHFFPRDQAALIRQATENGDARLWAGIHFPSDIETSRRMGEQLAALALARDAG